MHTKTACLSRVVVHYFNRKFFQFYKRYFIKFYHMKLLEIEKFCKFLGMFWNLSLTLKNFKVVSYHVKALENKEFCKFEVTKSDVFFNLIKFSDLFFSKTPIFPYIYYIFNFS